MKKYLSIFFVFVFLSMFTWGVPTIEAHGVAVSTPKEVGDYVLEFEYNVPEILAGETNSYVFRLLDKKTKQPILFDSLLIRFERKDDQATYLVARVVQDELQEGVGRLTAMLEKGDYIITTGFYKGDKKVAETTYDLSVLLGDNNKKFPVVSAVCIMIGLGLGYLVAKIGQNSSSKNHS